MAEENISQRFRLKNIDESKNFFIKEIYENEAQKAQKAQSTKHKKVYTTLNCIEYFLILASVVTGCISISVFASLLGIPRGITSSAI